jgi:hypothetical protein
LKNAFNPRNQDYLNDLFSKLFLKLIVSVCNTNGSEIIDVNSIRNQQHFGFEEHLPYPQILTLPEHIKAGKLFYVKL